MTTLDRIDRFIQAERLLSPGARVIVGLSGGADSVALLAALTLLGFDCVAVHCHFGLRPGEADRDLEHARAIAARLGAEFHCVRFDTQAHMAARGISAEMACRDLRYAEFERMRQNLGAEAIAVGHHRDDNVETLFLNLLRGSGIHGIRGMLPRRDHIIRPLLEISKAEILQFVDSQELDYVTDSSNFSNDFKRNRLRNQVLPALTEAFPDAAEKLTDSLRNLRRCEQLYNSLLPPRAEVLHGVDPTLIHEWLAPFGFNPTQCASMACAESGATFSSPTHTLTMLPHGHYELTPLDLKCTAPRLKWRTYPNSQAFRPQEGRLYLDARAAQGSPQWTMRPWQPGDRMRPFGMKGSRMVSDILAEHGVSAAARRNAMVLERDGEILWIVSVRASAHFPVTQQTENIIEIYEDI